MGPKISPEQQRDIVRRIKITKPDGTWAETYSQLAIEFGVTSPVITYHAKRAGVPMRTRPGWRRKRPAPYAFEPPETLRDMFEALCKKLGRHKARLLIEDHARIRKIAA
jgi:hypothetical protein